MTVAGYDPVDLCIVLPLPCGHIRKVYDYELVNSARALRPWSFGRQFGPCRVCAQLSAAVAVRPAPDAHLGAVGGE